MNVPTLRCALCSTVRRPRVHHPYLPMRSLCVCTSCKQHVCSRFKEKSLLVHEQLQSPDSPNSTAARSPGDAAPDSTTDSCALSSTESQCDDEAAPADDLFAELHPQVARLIVFVEKLLWSPSDDRELKPLRERIRYDYRKGIYKSPTNLGVDSRLLSAAAAVFPLINIKLVHGRLHFPLEAVALPKIGDLRDRIEVSYASLMGPAEAWDNTFPHIPWESELSSHAIFSQLLSLFGLSVMPEKRASRRRGDGTLILERNSVAAVLDAAVASIPPSLSSVIVTPGRKPRDHNLMRALALVNKSEDVPSVESGNHRCSCCGSGADNECYPFRFVTCTDCPRELCSICLEQVFGAGEYVRGLTFEKYRCPLCRVSLSAASATHEDSPLQRRREYRRAEFMRRQMQAIADDKPPKQRGRPRFPPLSLSRNMCRSLQRFSAPTRMENVAAGQLKGARPEAPLPSRDQVGFAKLCEDINMAALSSPMSSRTFPTQNQKGGLDFTPRPTTVCMGCRLPLGVPIDYDGRMNYRWNVYDANSNENSDLDGLKACQVPECGIILHEQCMKAVKVVGMTNRPCPDENQATLANGSSPASKSIAPDAILDTEKETVPGCSTDSIDKEDAQKGLTANDKELRRKTRAACDKQPTVGAGDGANVVRKANGDVSANESCKPGKLDCEWKCGRHVCKSCGDPDIVVRCRTCTTAYCAAHAPARDEIHLFGLKWMACESCKDYLDAPRVPYEPDAGAKFRVGANMVTLADALERERTISLTMINDIANLHSTLDSRDPGEMRIGIQKVHNQRSRREQRDTMKRSNVGRTPLKTGPSAAGSAPLPALDVQNGRVAKSRPAKERGKAANSRSKNISNGRLNGAGGGAVFDEFTRDPRMIGYGKLPNGRSAKRSLDMDEDEIMAGVPSAEMTRPKSLRNGLRAGVSRPPTSRGYRGSTSKAGPSRVNGRAEGKVAGKAEKTSRRANGVNAKRGHR